MERESRQTHRLRSKKLTQVRRENESNGQSRCQIRAKQSSLITGGVEHKTQQNFSSRILTSTTIPLNGSDIDVSFHL